MNLAEWSERVRSYVAYWYERPLSIEDGNSEEEIAEAASSNPSGQLRFEVLTDCHAAVLARVRHAFAPELEAKMVIEYRHAAITRYHRLFPE
ncbi:MAG: hypothetical protein HY901_03075 [Deltaproteobacteria bacterium]|nr:hypothetical protein [Deltaproteobacteria bacterium]